VATETTSECAGAAPLSVPCAHPARLILNSARRPRVGNGLLIFWPKKLAAITSAGVCLPTLWLTLHTSKRVDGGVNTDTLADLSKLQTALMASLEA
jgi:hypothetical protein